MFTGLIAELGSVEGIDRGGEGARLRLRTRLASEIAAGDSVAVSGVCLTASEVTEQGFAADVMNRTLELTSLGDLEPGGAVNLEPALRVSDRLGGHIVQGHVDATGEVVAIRDDGFARWLRIAIPPEVGRYAIERGSIAIDGVSLTVARLLEGAVEVSLIPETRERTTLGGAAAGTRVNLEIDVVARYAERLLQGFAPTDGSRRDG